MYVMLRFKNLNILKESGLVYHHTEPYRFCIILRVTKKKGIEDAVNSVKTVNENFVKTVYTSDIYGQVDSAQTEWFNELKTIFSSYIKYDELVSFNISAEVLKK